VYFASVFDRVLKLRGWGTVNKLLPTNWSDREKGYSELSVSLGQEDIFQMGVVEEEEKETEEVEEEEDPVRDLLSTHSVWLRM
jgi:hypothetical protein